MGLRLAPPHSAGVKDRRGHPAGWAGRFFLGGLSRPPGSLRPPKKKQVFFGYLPTVRNNLHRKRYSADGIARGMAPEEAARAARRKLGNPTLIREEIYQMNTLGWVETTLAGPSLRLTRAAKSSQFHRRCRAVARSWHRRSDCHLQRGLWCAAVAVSVRQARRDVGAQHSRPQESQTGPRRIFPAGISGVAAAAGLQTR